MSKRRVWADESGFVYLRENDGSTRKFWAPTNGGYVREVDNEHPGLAGAQVCARLGPQGPTLSGSRDGLLWLIRREYQRRVARASGHKPVADRGDT